MDKRYQVFISSTFSDLQTERQEVMKVIMQLDCIPAGMELFPASNDEQFDFIKKVIDDCDYYILIIGGRYGSEDIDGISYTEKEYDYAISLGIPVMSFIHGKPNDIPFGKSELDPEKRDKLDRFKNKISSNKLVKFWYKPEELEGAVALSLSKAIKMYARPGWVRGGTFNNDELLEQLNMLRIERDNLVKESKELKETLEKNEINDIYLSFMQDKIHVVGYFADKAVQTYKSIWETKYSWNKLIIQLFPLIMDPQNYSVLKEKLTEFLIRDINLSAKIESIDDRVFDTIKARLLDVDLIYISYSKIEGENTELIHITSKGLRYLNLIHSIQS
jgi:hypothetical protein